MTDVERCPSCGDEKTEDHGEQCSNCGACPANHDTDHCVRILEADVMYMSKILDRKNQESLSNNKKEVKS